VRQRVIFVVDSSYRRYFQMGKEEFHKATQFVKKQEIEEAVTPDQLATALDLQMLNAKRYHMEAEGMN
jgi:hypothetical protein